MTALNLSPTFQARQRPFDRWEPEEAALELARIEREAHAAVAARMAAQQLGEAFGPAPAR